jgi:hypothetical protein
MGWDCYQPIGVTNYEAANKFLSIPIGAAIQAGVPLAVAELGAVRVPSDQTGNGRAQWITDCTTHLRETGCAAVNWWHATGTNGADYRLSDGPSAQAWRAAIALS